MRGMLGWYISSCLPARRLFGHTLGSNACTRHLSTSSKRAGAVPMTFTCHSIGPRHTTSRQTPVVIMHGLMGSKTNWMSMGKAISAKTGREVYTVDARNHGNSPHAEGHSYPLLAEDILLFLQDRNIPRAILMGHSMGGRAVMATSLIEPSVVEKLVVLDISPIGTSKSISTLPRFMEIMRRVQVPPGLTLPEARKHIDSLLVPAISEASIRQFLLTNLIPGEGGYRWQLNLEGIAKNFNPHISTFPASSLPHSVFEGETAFVGGALSDYLRPDDEDAILDIFPQASFHYLEGAGHWLHSERPKQFLELMVPLLSA